VKPLLRGWLLLISFEASGFARLGAAGSCRARRARLAARGRQALRAYRDEGRRRAAIERVADLVEAALRGGPYTRMI